MTKAEVMEIINTPTKHIQIVKIDGKDSIVYSAKFVELLEAIPEMFDNAVPLSMIDEIKADIEGLIKTYERNYGKDLGMIFGLKNALELIDQNVKEYIK